MAQYDKNGLKSASDAAFPNNDDQSITPQIHRLFNDDFAESTLTLADDNTATGGTTFQGKFLSGDSVNIKKFASAIPEGIQESGLYYYDLIPLISTEPSSGNCFDISRSTDNPTWPIIGFGQGYPEPEVGYRALLRVVDSPDGLLLRIDPFGNPTRTQLIQGPYDYIDQDDGFGRLFLPNGTIFEVVLQYPDPYYGWSITNIQYPNERIDGGKIYTYLPSAPTVSQNETEGYFVGSMIKDNEGSDWIAGFLTPSTANWDKLFGTVGDIGSGADLELMTIPSDDLQRCSIIDGNYLRFGNTMRLNLVMEGEYSSIGADIMSFTLDLGGSNQNWQPHPDGFNSGFGFIRDVNHSPERSTWIFAKQFGEFFLTYNNPPTTVFEFNVTLLFQITY